MPWGWKRLLSGDDSLAADAGRLLQVAWHTGGDTLQRDYYLFTYREIEQLARRAGFRVIRSFPEARYRFPLKHFSKNICLLLGSE